MKYFRTSNATRPHKAGGTSFKFEPVALVSSSWVGVYATDNEQDIEALSQLRGVTEIGLDAYNSLKKKEVKTTAPKKVPTDKAEEKEKPVVGDLKKEVIMGKANYVDSIEKN